VDLLSLPPKTMPNLNLYRVVNLIWKRGAISRIEVAEELGLTKSTVTKVVVQLLESALVLEDEVTKTAVRGRPRVALRLNPLKGQVLGLEIRTDGWTVVLTGFDGKVHERTVESRTWSSLTLVDDVSLILSRWLGGPRTIPITAAGVSVPGIVDARRGILLRSNPLGIQEPLFLGPILEERFGRPFTVENDANCGCWGELAFGASPSSEPFLFVLCEDRRHRLADETLGRVPAVGFGLVLNGKPWWGPDHSAGEFSSVFKSPEDTLQFSLPPHETSRVFEQPQLEARMVNELARQVGLLVNFLNLKAVYVSWPSSGHAELVLEAIGNCIQQNWLYPAPVDCRVQRPTGGDDAVAWGAAGLTLERLWGESAFDDDQPRWK